MEENYLTSDSKKLRLSAVVYYYCRLSGPVFLNQTLYDLSTVQPKSIRIYHKIEKSNTSRLEAHGDFFRWFIKGIFDPYVLRSFDKKLIF